jgi:hypothetical protein
LVKRERAGGALQTREGIEEAEGIARGIVGGVWEEADFGARLTRLAQHVLVEQRVVWLHAKAAASEGDDLFHQLTSQVQSNLKRAIQFGYFLRRKRTYIICQHRLGQAHQFVAMNAALVLQAFIYAHFHLRTQAIMLCKDGRANHCRKSGVDKGLATHDHKRALALWVARIGVRD